MFSSLEHSNQDLRSIAKLRSTTIFKFLFREFKQFAQGYSGLFHSLPKSIIPNLGFAFLPNMFNAVFCQYIFVMLSKQDSHLFLR